MDRVIPSLAFGRALVIFLLSKNGQKNPNVNFMKKSISQILIYCEQFSLLGIKYMYTILNH